LIEFNPLRSAVSVVLTSWNSSKRKYAKLW